MEIPLTLNYGNKQFGTLEWDTTDGAVSTLIELLTQRNYIIAPAYKIYANGVREIYELSIIPYENYQVGEPNLIG